MNNEGETMNNSVPCPICRFQCRDVRQVAGKDVMECDCPRCGDYSIAGEAASHLQTPGMSMQDRAKMAAYLRERTLRGDPRIRIFSQLPANKKFDTPVTTAEEIIRQGFPLSISERLDRARGITRRCGNRKRQWQPLGFSTTHRADARHRKEAPPCRSRTQRRKSRQVLSGTI